MSASDLMVSSSAFSGVRFSAFASGARPATSASHSWRTNRPADLPRLRLTVRDEAVARAAHPQREAASRSAPFLVSK